MNENNDKSNVQEDLIAINIKVKVPREYTKEKDNETMVVSVETECRIHKDATPNTHLYYAFLRQALKGTFDNVAEKMKIAREIAECLKDGDDNQTED